MITHRYKTILGDIPNDWQAKPLRTLLTTQFSGDWGSDDGERAISVLRSTNFSNSGILDFNNIATRFFSSVKTETFGLKKGDLLVERSGGGPDQPVGRIGFIFEDLPETTVSNFVQVLRPNPEKVNSEFLGWVLYQLQETGIVERVQQQSTQMRNLNWRDYQRLLLPWPNTDEQNRIITVIRQVDELMIKTSIELKSLEEVKCSLMSEVFEKGLNPNVNKKAYKIHRCYTASVPVHWDTEPLGRGLLSVEYGTNAPSNEYKSGYPVIAIPQVVTPQLNLSEVPYAEVTKAESVALRLMVDDILLIRTNGNPEYIGKSTIVTKEVADMHTIFASYLIRLRTNKTRIYGAYLNYFLASPLGKRQAGAVANTSAGNNNIGARAIKHFKFPRPPLDEQELIINLFNKIEERKDTLSTKMITIQTLKKSLLKKLLTGQIRIPKEVIYG